MCEECIQLEVGDIRTLLGPVVGFCVGQYLGRVVAETERLPELDEMIQVARAMFVFAAHMSQLDEPGELMDGTFEHMKTELLSGDKHLTISANAGALTALLGARNVRKNGVAALKWYMQTETLSALLIELRDQFSAMREQLLAYKAQAAKLVPLASEP